MEILFGASFSLKYCHEMGVDPKKCLKEAISDLGVKRLRLMSYWDVHESVQGRYDFQELDWQVEMAERFGIHVSLCLGLRQPRWPESHWPAWALNMPDETWKKALYDYITEVICRYKGYRCIVSYQLENEALLKSFGLNGNFDRSRLRKEFDLVKSLDPDKPIIMSTSDAWGIPWRAPKADIYGFSIYRYLFDAKKDRYVKSGRTAIYYRFRAVLIKLLRRRQVYIHELQAEPWGPKATSKLSVEEQFESMSLEHVNEAVQYAKASTLLPADLWGLEWWYWLKDSQKMPEIWNYLKSEVF